MFLNKNLTIFGPGDHLSSRVLSPFHFNGILYANLQHYFLHAKALLFKDYHQAALILASLDVGEREVLGNDITGFDEAIWASRREVIMLDGCREKFIQNRTHRGILLRSGDSMLVYANEYDPVWGTGISPDDPRIGDPSQWTGSNLLGFALAQVRAYLLTNPDAYHPDRITNHRRSPYRQNLPKGTASWPTRLVQEHNSQASSCREG